MLNRYIDELENRIRELEALLSRPSPAVGPSSTSAVSAQPPIDHTLPSSPRIGPEQPLAHEVGLLSLQAANSPKYLGPSSGVAFARLIFASAPHTQGLSTALSSHLPQSDESNVPCASSLPSLPEIHRFVAAYFDHFQHVYPFLDELYVDDIIEKCSADTSNANMSILFLVIAIGSRTLESQLGADFASPTFLAAGMKYLADVPLHESIQGVQTMLLLVLNSFCFPGALNAWFLTHTILASCLDLGLQRKQAPGTGSRSTMLQEHH